MGQTEKEDRVGELSVEEAEKAARNARLALEGVEAQIGEAKRLAAVQIDAQFAEVRKAARDAAALARQAERDAKDRTPDHPWTGKRVYRMAAVGRPGWAARSRVRVEGVVETRRSDTAFPGNTAHYNFPAIGDGFVRLLKSDGTPGLKFDRLYNLLAWKLVDEPKAGEP